MDYKWYTIAVYSGSEAAVSAKVEKLLSEDSNIKEIFIPTKKAYKISKGKKVEVTQKLFPNYVFVNMICERATLDKIRELPRVMGFVGANPTKPDVVPEEDIIRMKNDSEKEVTPEEDRLEIGDTIRIKEGHFESFNGVVEGKDENKNVLKVSITIFGRSTMVEIEPSKVEKIV
jgi:transcriptional antiterminator NusG